MLKNIFVLLFCFGFTFSYASSKKYTISVCTTSSMQNALTCKKRIDESMMAEVFIVEDKKGFYTYIGKFDNKQEANLVMKSASSYVKKQKPYIKSIEIKEEKKPVETEIVKADEPVETKEEVVKEETKRVETIPLVSIVPYMEDLKPVGSYHFIKDEEINQEPKKESLEERFGLKDSNKLSKEDEKRKEEYINESKKEPEPKVEVQKEIEKIEPKKAEIQKVEEQIDSKIENELIQVSMDEFDRANKLEKKSTKKLERILENKLPPKKIEEKKEQIDTTLSVNDFEQIILEVDSITNKMIVKVKVDDEFKDYKNFIVSTAKKSVKKPLGEGKVSQISLDPVWYPTEDTKKTFRKKDIELPSVVPPGHKYNFMGAAKINLTHKVDGKNTYRIHGTLNEKTIGTNESAGCIRMKNSDVLELATLLNDFADIKSLNSVKVILK